MDAGTMRATLLHVFVVLDRRQLRLPDLLPLCVLRLSQPGCVGRGGMGTAHKAARATLEQLTVSIMIELMA